MEDIVFVIVAWFFLEFLFWTIAYATGSVLVFLISFGQSRRPLSISKLHTLQKSNHTFAGELAIPSPKRHWSNWGIALLGLVFWVALFMMAVLIY